MINLSTARRLGILIPRGLRPIGKKLLAVVSPSIFKYQEELSFWHEYKAHRGGSPWNEHYERIMLALANEPTADFLTNKIVADFGCGPTGSLCWATPAKVRIGIDVLADCYTPLGIRDHPMVYVKSSETKIPLPSGYVDFMFTLNAMDHVSRFPAICREIIRILAPGGLFLGSFNLGEPPTFSEPQHLTEKLVNDTLLRSLRIESYKVGPVGGDPNDTYKHMINHVDQPFESDRKYLWVRARKA